MRQRLKRILSGAGLIACTAVPASAADPLERCAAIDDPDQRLACFDRLTLERRDHRDSVSTREQERRPAAAAQQRPRPISGPTAAEAPAADRLEVQGKQDSEDPAARFGRNRPQDAAADLDRIEATIEQVRKGPLGRQVMTLSNGQVWMENEPGKRPIARGQRVVIRRHRLHYEMELPSQPDVAVRRLE